MGANPTYSADTDSLSDTRHLQVVLARVWADTSATLALTSLAYGILLIGLRTFQREVLDTLTVFSAIYLLPILIILWSVLILFSLGNIALTIIQRQSHQFPRAFMPLVINIATILVLVFVPLPDIWLDMRFPLFRTDYEEVVRRIEIGEITHEERDVVLLPLGFRYLSSGGGEVIVEDSDSELHVLFFTFRGILDSSSGFAYTSDGLAVEQYEFGQEWCTVEPIAPNWFYLASCG